MYSCRFKKFAKVRLSKCRLCLMRSNEAEVVDHGCLISVNVITLCACIEWWPNDEVGYARVQMTSSCVAQWRQSSFSNIYHSKNWRCMRKLVCSSLSREKKTVLLRQNAKDRLLYYLGISKYSIQDIVCYLSSWEFWIGHVPLARVHQHSTAAPCKRVNFKNSLQLFNTAIFFFTRHQ